MRVATWEELRMEIKKLKSRLGIKLSKEEKEMKEEDGENKDDQNDILKENMSELDGSINGTGGEFDENRKWLEDSVKNL